MASFKKCPICKRKLPLGSYYLNPNTGYFSAYCKKCRKHRNKQWKRDHDYTDRHSKLSLKRKYGISIGDYNILFLKQDGKCAICGVHQKDLKKKLSVDHNHGTGKVRGLLCPNCNSAIGMLKDDPLMLKAAIDYLSLYV